MYFDLKLGYTILIVSPFVVIEVIMKKIKNSIKIIKEIGLKGFIVKAVKKILGFGQYEMMKNFKEIENFFHEKRGLEIGGPSLFFEKKGFMPVYDKLASLDGVNFSSSTVWTGKINEEKGFVINGKCVGKQYILDAVDLASVQKNFYDFVLSCNNIEHIANPMKAMKEWLSVLKLGGVLVIVVPRKEANFDHKREIVRFSHLVGDYENKIGEDDLSHLEEILELHDMEMGSSVGTMKQFRERSLKNFENRCLHQHVFDLNVLEEMCRYFNLSVIKSIQLEGDYVIIGKKTK